jgi:hypothetical protein
MYPSIKTIQTQLNLDKDTAKRIRELIDKTISPLTSEAVQKWIRQCYNRPSDNELIMCAIDETLNTFGVEAIEGEWIDHYHQNIQAVYCNTGDTYSSTVFLCYKHEKFLIMSYYDYYKKNINPSMTAQIFSTPNLGHLG